MRNDMVRMSIDVPANIHKMIKYAATFHEETIRDLMVRAAMREVEELQNKIPNEETLETFHKTDKGEGLNTYSSMNEMFKALGL